MPLENSGKVYAQNIKVYSLVIHNLSTIVDRDWLNKKTVFATAKTVFIKPKKFCLFYPNVTSAFSLIAMIVLHPEHLNLPERGALSFLAHTGHAI